MTQEAINTPLITEDDAVIVPLLPSETELGMMIGQPICTGTFYEGVAPIDFLRSRIIDIVAKNQWLLGRFVKHNGKVVLKYKNIFLKENIDISSVFTVINENELEKKEYESNNNVTWLSKYGIKSAINCVGKDEPIFRVTIINIEQGKYVLMVSLNHVIGDGFVFYKLYGMLDSNAEIKSLKINREFAIHAKLIDTHGKDEVKYFKSIGTLFNLIGGMLCGIKKNIIRHRIVDNNYVDSVKKDYIKNNIDLFISTNDILSSCLYNASECDVGLLAINFRNRFSGLTDEHAGNYEGVKAYHSEDIKYPALIRQSVNQNFIRPVSGNNKGGILPGFCTKYWAKNVLISNWSGLYEHIDLPNSTQLLHIPILKEEVVPFHGVFIIYRMNKNQIGICSFKGFVNNLDKDIECASKPVNLVQEFNLYDNTVKQ